MAVVSVKNINWDAEFMRLDGWDSKKEKAIFIIANLISPRKSVTFTIKNGKAVENLSDEALLEIHSFGSEPPIMGKKPDGTTYYPISFKENISLKATSLLLARKRN